MRTLGGGMLACGGYWIGVSGGILPSLDPLWFAGVAFLLIGSVLVGLGE